jgi:NAD(P)-dependent dehydrogenase (short-subunit alcohol dehydrogenase family)
MNEAGPGRDRNAGRRAVVTGGAGGIGLSITERLVSDGFDVVSGDIDREAGARLAARLPVQCEYLDASSEQSMRDFIGGCGDVYALVNNIGIRGATGDVWSIPVGDFRSTFEVNLHSHLLAAQLVAPAMMRRCEGVIVEIASGAARTGAVARAPYGISKWALLGLTKSLAHELAPWSIRANAVLPGNVNGERFMGSMRLHAEHEGVPVDHVLDRFMGMQPLRRLVEPAEIAGAVSYLVSDDAVGVTGLFLDVSGGRF